MGGGGEVLHAEVDAEALHDVAGQVHVVGLDGDRARPVHDEAQQPVVSENEEVKLQTVFPLQFLRQQKVLIEPHDYSLDTLLDLELHPALRLPPLVRACVDKNKKKLFQQDEVF